jgi:pimeloyl-ACP methyl ester carboxylesterase
MPDEFWVHLDAADCAVRVQITGDGPSLLFLHGVMNAGTGWAPLVDLLGAFRCMLVDLPGCGLSDPLPEPLGDIDRFATYADGLVVDVLDALDVDRTATISTNQGGYLALRGAAAHPGRIQRLVHLGWTVGAPVDRVPLAMRVGASVGRTLASLSPTRAMVRTLLRQVGLGRAIEDGRVSEESLSWYLSLLRDTPTVTNELETGPQLIRPVRGMDPRVLLGPELLARVTLPVLFLWGEDDQFAGPGTARAFAAQLPDAQVQILPGTGHAPWLDHPECVAATIEGFLRPG